MKPSEALDLCGSDKVIVHSYGAFYDEFASRTDVRRLLEIGVQSGHSIRAWRRVWPDAEIYGIDISPKPPGYPDGGKCHFAQLDATDPDAMAAQLTSWGDVGFDLIIDDGSHRLADQIATWGALCLSVNRGGVYVIEDVEPSSIHTLMDTVEGRLYDFRAASGRFDDVAIAVW